ncbi:MAG TPA: SDR family NAD(P)-dependent oxidoreductase [Acetobacteraceae bacterium]|nr:SDR family NAD(P)-dependent oxidoreductase [Acetobacteraceae bacterium]
MDLELRGKRALVTGSSSGLGAAIAVELAAEGVAVAVHGRDRDRAEHTARDVAAHGVTAVVTSGDLSRDEDAKNVAEAALQGLGGIDILVNNAGAVLRMDNPDWLDVTPTEWLDSFNLNVCAALRLTQHLVPHMRAQGWGRIINISSTAGSQTRGFLLDYSAPKAGVDNMTVNLSKLLAKDGITVNAIIPGTILTPAVERWFATLRQQLNWPDDIEENERVYTAEVTPQPIPRLGRPREIAVAAALLASPLSGYTTGAFLRIDGGTADAIGA